MTKKSMYGVAGLCLALAIMSGVWLSQELAPFFRGSNVAPGSLEAIDEDTRFGYGYSSYSKYLTLRDCFTGMRELKAREVPAETAPIFYKKCVDVSTHIIAGMPTNSFAWYVKARAHAGLGEVADYNESLRQSQQMGPNEQWIAELRVALAENNIQMLDNGGSSAHEQDLTLLASSPLGTQSIAERYISNPEFRERITSIVEKMPTERQRTFLRNVRRTMSQG